MHNNVHWRMILLNEQLLQIVSSWLSSVSQDTFLDRSTLDIGWIFLFFSCCLWIVWIGMLQLEESCQVGNVSEHLIGFCSVRKGIYWLLQVYRLQKSWRFHQEGYWPSGTPNFILEEYNIKVVVALSRDGLVGAVETFNYCLHDCSKDIEDVCFSNFLLIFLSLIFL